jgi:hypothetical protein
VTVILRAKRLLAIFALEKYADELAEADFQTELLLSAALRNADEKDREARRKGVREGVREGYKELRATLCRALALTASAIGAGFLINWIIRACGSWSKGAPWLLGITSLGLLTWATLGRLQWESWKRQMSPEQADRDVLRVLYWLGTCAGALAFLASG